MRGASISVRLEKIDLYFYKYSFASVYSSHIAYSLCHIKISIEMKNMYDLSKNIPKFRTGSEPLINHG